MKITVDRFTSDADSTLSMVSINGVFECFGLEDEYRENKVVGETRIPSGKYNVLFRNWGGFYSRYLKRFPDFHSAGMLQVLDVPGFTSILIHMGNKDKDTAGCLLVGVTATGSQGDMSLGNSRGAYTNFYQKVAEALRNRNEKVTIEYVNNDR